MPRGVPNRKLAKLANVWRPAKKEPGHHSPEHDEEPAVTLETIKQQVESRVRQLTAERNRLKAELELATSELDKLDSVAEALGIEVPNGG